MRHDPSGNNIPDPYVELIAAGAAGGRLITERREFRQIAETVLGCFSLAAHELDDSGFTPTLEPVREAYDAAHDSYARFVFETLSTWAGEDGPADKFFVAAHRMKPRTRLDDIAVGRVAARADAAGVVRIFEAGAKTEFIRDRPAAQRLLCVALLWDVDVKHMETEAGWAARSGVFPGSEAAPTFAKLLWEHSLRTEEPRSRKARALRAASGAVSGMAAVAEAYGRACCAAYEFGFFTGEARD